MYSKRDSGGPLYLKRDDNELKQIGITSFSNTGCAEEYGVPWYVRANEFKWGMNDLIDNGKYRNIYLRWNGDLTQPEREVPPPAAAADPEPESERPGTLPWFSWDFVNRANKTNSDDNSANEILTETDIGDDALDTIELADGTTEPDVSEVSS